MRKFLLIAALLLSTTSVTVAEKPLEFTIHVINENVEEGLIISSYTTDAHNKKLKNLQNTPCIEKGKGADIRGQGASDEKIVFVTGEAAKCNQKNTKFPAFAPNMDANQRTYKVKCAYNGDGISCRPVK